MCARYAYCEDFEKSEWRYFFKEINLIASVERMKKRYQSLDDVHSTEDYPFIFRYTYKFQKEKIMKKNIKEY